MISPTKNLSSWTGSLLGIRGKVRLREYQPQLSLKEVRERCAEAKKQLGGGIDPSAEKKLKAKSGQTSLEAVVRERHCKQVPTWSVRHDEDVMERLEKNIFPFLGKHQPNDITPPQLLAVFRRIEGRGVIEVAHRVWWYLLPSLSL